MTSVRRLALVLALTVAGACGSGQEASDRITEPVDRARDTADRAEQRPDDVPEDPGY